MKLAQKLFYHASNYLKFILKYIKYVLKYLYLGIYIY
jgi:hypothetical protein